MKRLPAPEQAADEAALTVLAIVAVLILVHRLFFGRWL